jgi:hypothetical protein
MDRSKTIGSKGHAIIRVAFVVSILHIMRKIPVVSPNFRQTSPSATRAICVNVAFDEAQAFKALSHRTLVIGPNIRNYRRTDFFQLRCKEGGYMLIARHFGNAQIDQRERLAVVRLSESVSNYGAFGIHRNP